MRKSYYPPGSSPQNGPHCDYEPAINPAQVAFMVKMTGRYEPGNRKCLLSPGHEGDHNDEANWHAHVEVNSRSYGSGIEIGFRSWHDSRGLTVRNREEADALLHFLGDCFEEAFQEAVGE